jgi:Mlc titration factor MtfA (ptsG expression regulator)
MWNSNRNREWLLTQPYPEGWESFLVNNVAHYRLLDSEEQTSLRNDSRVLVAEKNWEGCGGLTLSDEMKVTIAAQAALMLLGREHDYFRRVPTILVYPSTFVIPADEGLEERQWEIAATGQAVPRGPVILAWDAVLAEGREPSLGRNVVIHEFAHQLDFLVGSIDDPSLGDPELEQRWREVMPTEYRALVRALDRGRPTLLGEYAGTDEREFFAVASEIFFTRPDQLQQRHAELYRLMADFYRLEPVQWFRRSTSE